MTARRRLDNELVRRGLASDLDIAARLIGEHRVVVAGTIATNSTRMVGSGESLHVSAPPAKYVSRGGLKLEAALDRFGIEVAGRRAIDIGSSTGGFTDCLLQRGAGSVVAVDVGKAQLHERLRTDPGVDSREQTDVRDVELGERFTLVTADLSFISLRSVADVIVKELSTTGADLILLIKPQFEATRAEASAGKGVITDSEVWRRTLTEVLSAMSSRGAATMGVMVSPIRGAKGNVEFLAWLRNGQSGQVALSSAIDAAIGDAG